VQNVSRNDWQYKLLSGALWCNLEAGSGENIPPGASSNLASALNKLTNNRRIKMNWMFWKPEPEPEPEPEKLYIPEDHIEKVLELFDAYYALPEGQDRVAKFRLWRLWSSF